MKSNNAISSFLDLDFILPEIFSRKVLLICHPFSWETILRLIDCCSNCWDKLTTPEYYIERTGFAYFINDHIQIELAASGCLKSFIDNYSILLESYVKYYDLNNKNVAFL